MLHMAVEGSQQSKRGNEARSQQIQNSPTLHNIYVSMHVCMCENFNFRFGTLTHTRTYTHTLTNKHVHNDVQKCVYTKHAANCRQSKENQSRRTLLATRFWFLRKLNEIDFNPKCESSPVCIHICIWAWCVGVRMFSVLGASKINFCLFHYLNMRTML